MRGKGTVALSKASRKECTASQNFRAKALDNFIKLPQKPAHFLLILIHLGFYHSLLLRLLQNRRPVTRPMSFAAMTPTMRGMVESLFFSGRSIKLRMHVASVAAILVQGVGLGLLRCSVIVAAVTELLCNLGLDVRLWLILLRWRRQQLARGRWRESRGLQGSMHCVGGWG